MAVVAKTSAADLWVDHQGVDRGDPAAAVHEDPAQAADQSPSSSITRLARVVVERGGEVIDDVSREGLGDVEPAGDGDEGLEIGGGGEPQHRRVVLLHSARNKS